MKSQAPLSLTQVFGYEDGAKRHTVIVVEAGLLTLTGHRPTVGGSVATGADARGKPVKKHFPMRSLMALALRDERVSKVLRLTMQDGEPWVSLFRILEVVESDVGGQRGIDAKGWAKLKDLNRFTHTANSPAVLGDFARHGDSGNAPPAKPMSLKDAKELIGQVVERWIAENDPGAV